MNSYRVIFTDEAQSDLDDIFDYILSESSNAMVAESFATELIHTIKEALSFMPIRHPVYKNQVRRFVFPKHTSYCAFFKIDEKRQSVFILALTDSKQFTRYMKLQ